MLTSRIISLPRSRTQEASVVAVIRGVVAAACFAPLLAGSGDTLRRAPPAFWKAAIELTAYNALYEGLLSLSVVHADATRAAFLFESSVLWTPAIAAIGGARVPPTTWVAAATAVIGVALLAGDAGTLSFSPGDAEALAAALAYSAYVLRLGAGWTAGGEAEGEEGGMPSREVMQGVKCAFMLLVYAAWAASDAFTAASATGAHSPQDLAAVMWPGAASGAAWAVLIYSGAVPGALADVAQAKGQARVGPAEAQILLASEPLWTALLGAAALGERLSGRDTAGAALIVGAVGISSGLVRRLAAATRRRLRAMAGFPPL
jgi:drug/metabolite transporter (DMT)-like permease